MCKKNVTAQVELNITGVNSIHKDYFLTLLFIKYLNDVHDDKLETYLKKYNTDIPCFLLKTPESCPGKNRRIFSSKEVSDLLSKLTKSKQGSHIGELTCGSTSLLIKSGEEVSSDNLSLYGQEGEGNKWT